MNTKVAKKTFDEIDAEMKEKYFANKVDMTPATIKTVSSCLDGKTETIVSRILEVNGKPFMGIDYDNNGDPVGAWMADARGRRVPIRMPEKEVETKDAIKVLEKISTNLLRRVQKEKDVEPKETKTAVSKVRPIKTKQVTREVDLDIR